LENVNETQTACNFSTVVNGIESTLSPQSPVAGSERVETSRSNAVSQ